MRKFIPTWTNHLIRYVFAMDYCKRKRVMDAGCQTGFGAHLLSFSANSVSLVDISNKNLATSINKYKFDCPIEALNCDFEEDFPKGGWDTIVAFEVIEHLANPEFFIKNVTSHLPIGGQLVFSVPHMIANKEHKTLFNEKGIRDLIGRHLKITEFYLQDKKVFSNRLNYKGVKYYVGVAEKVTL